MLRWMVAAVFMAATAVQGAEALLPQVSSGTLERVSSFSSVHVPARTVDIWLPPGYPKAAPYAVLYMHDGQMLFDANTTWNKQEWQVDEVASALQTQGKARPFIVVAVHNGEQNRHAEYFPQQPFAALTQAQQELLYQAERSPGIKLFSQPVYSDQYLKFLVTELKPYIDKKYRVATDAQSTALMGSSMGGLISMYGLLQYPDVFGAAACLSTHWPGAFSQDHNPVPAQFQAYLSQKLPAPGKVRLYFDYGDQTLDAWYPPLQQKIDAIMQHKGYSETQWQSRFFPGAAHTESAWAARLDQPLLFLFGRATP
ncbi:alpha/beta hydrolase-fold protein [Rheinheimera sp.]|uniref:alpha/beta hydrolase n=1 Tax=Rheinheimera sp. TaxID=1869214 RepID=UPI00307EBF28